MDENPVYDFRRCHNHGWLPAKYSDEGAFVHVYYFNLALTLQRFVGMHRCLRDADSRVRLDTLPLGGLSHGPPRDDVWRRRVPLSARLLQASAVCERCQLGIGRYGRHGRGLLATGARRADATL